MRVALLLSGGSTIWLAGKPGVSEREWSSVSDFLVTPSINVQNDQFIRAAEAKVADRKNLLLTITFGTVQKFATASQAQLFATDYYLGQQRSGTLLLDIPQAGGSSIFRYQPNAVVDPPIIRTVGVSVIMNYTVRGPAFRSA